MKPDNHSRKKPTLQKWSKRLLVLLLAGGMLLGLTACEESLAFTEIDYWHDQDEIDYEQDPAVDDDEDHVDENELETQSARDDSDRDNVSETEEMSELDDSAQEDEQEAAETEYNSDADDEGETAVASAEAVVSDDTSAASNSPTSNGRSSAGNGADASSRESGGTGVSAEAGDAVLGGSTGDSDRASNIGADEDSDVEESDLNAGTDGRDEESLEGDNGTAGDEGGENGSDQEDPEQPDDPIVSCGTVIATGEAAILTQMLGGEGALYGTDAATLAAMSAYFPDEELDGVEVLWSGDGTDALDTDKLDSLIAEGKTPGACLLDASAFSSSSVTALQARGVSCGTLSFESFDDILASVNVVAATLGTDYASAMKTEYLAFCSEMQALAGDYDTTRYTLYVSDWDSAVTYRRYDYFVTGLTWSKTGVAVASNLNDSPIDDMWAWAGVNDRYDYAINSNSGLLGTDYYYIGTIRDVMCHLYLDNATYDYSIERVYCYLATNLGSDVYPAVVLGSQEMESSWLEDMAYSDDVLDGGLYSVYNKVKVSGNYMVTACGGTITSFGRAAIFQDYDVYVNPCGLGDWAAGSAESILEAPWIAWKIQGTCTEDEVRTAIADYYAKFYRCTGLTGSQVDSILAGKES